MRAVIERAKIWDCSFTEKIKPRNEQTEKFSTFKDKLWKKTDAAETASVGKPKTRFFCRGWGRAPMLFSVMIFFRSAIEALHIGLVFQHVW